MLSEYSLESINSAFDELINQAVESLANEGVSTADLRILKSVDLCYRGQAFTLNLAWQGIDATETNFHQQHERHFGHRLDAPVELVNVRIGVLAQETDIDIRQDKPGSVKGPESKCRVYGIDLPVPVWSRHKSGMPRQVHGPAIIVDDMSTIFIEPEWDCRIDNYGNLLLEKDQAGATPL